jgi:hypothetical protein
MFTELIMVLLLIVSIVPMGGYIFFAIIKLRDSDFFTQRRWKFSILVAIFLVGLVITPIFLIILFPYMVFGSASLITVLVHQFDLFDIMLVIGCMLGWVFP